MNIGLAGFLSGLSNVISSFQQKRLLTDLALEQYKKQLEIKNQELEKQRQGLLNALLGSPVQVPTFMPAQLQTPTFGVSLTKPQSVADRIAGHVSLGGSAGLPINPDNYSLGKVEDTTEYAGGLLSDLVSRNPYLRDVIAGSVYGLRLPLPQIVRGKTGVYEINPLTGETKTIEKVNDVKFLKALDLGDRVVPLLSVNGVPTVPAEYLKGLSPEAKLKFKQWQKEYGLKVKRLGLDAAKFNWQKAYQQAQLGLEQERINLSKQKKQVAPKTVVQTAKTELEELLKTYGVVDPFGGIDGTKLDALRKANPEAYNRITYLLGVLKSANDSLVKDAGLPVKQTPQRKKLTKADAFLLKTFPDLILGGD